MIIKKKFKKKPAKGNKKWKHKRRRRNRRLLGKFKTLRGRLAGIYSSNYSHCGGGEEAERTEISADRRLQSLTMIVQTNKSEL